MISIISTLLDEEFLLMQTHVQLYDRVNVTCEAPQMTEEDIRAHLLREEQRVRGLSSSGRLLTKRKLLQDLQMERNDLDKQLRTMEQNL